MYIEKLASNLNRNDEFPNIELAENLCTEENSDGVAEIVSALKMKQTVANDAIKVLYEIGERKPQLILPFTAMFIDLLQSKNNRLVWGAMTALSTIAELAAEEIYLRIDTVKTAFENGSVITADNGVSVLAKVCKAKSDSEKELFPYLLNHIIICRPKETAQHAERMSVCVNTANKADFIAALQKRKSNLTAAQIKRIDRLIKNLD